MGRTPDDPNNDPTQMADYEYGRSSSYDEPGYYSEYREPTGQQPRWSEPPPPTPWYLRPVALVGLGVLTALLIALLVWGMVRLVHQDSGSTTPSTTSSTTVAPTDESIPPSPQPVAPNTPTDENPPPATTPEPSTTAPPTTESPTTTVSTTEPPTTTEPPSSTTAPSTTTGSVTTTTAPRPPEIVIPLPPGPESRRPSRGREGPSG